MADTKPIVHNGRFVREISSSTWSATEYGTGDTTLEFYPTAGQDRGTEREKKKQGTKLTVTTNRTHLGTKAQPKEIEATLCFDLHHGVTTINGRPASQCPSVHHFVFTHLQSCLWFQSFRRQVENGEESTRGYRLSMTMRKTQVRHCVQNLQQVLRYGMSSVYPTMQDMCERYARLTCPSSEQSGTG